MRFYEDDGMNTSMNQRKMVQDARRRQAVVLVNRNSYRYHGEKIKSFVQDKTAIQLLRKDSVLERLKELQRRRIVEQRNQVTIMITTGSLTFIVLLAAIVTWFLFMTPVIENIGKIFQNITELLIWKFTLLFLVLDRLQDEVPDVLLDRLHEEVPDVVLHRQQDEVPDDFINLGRK